MNQNLAEDAQQAVDHGLVAILNGVPKDKLAELLYRWVLTKPRKRAVLTSSDPLLSGHVVYVRDATQFKKLDQTDLPLRLEEIRLRLRSLANALEFSVVKDKVSVVATGSPGHLLDELCYGSSWFDGDPDFVGYVVSEILRGI